VAFRNAAADIRNAATVRDLKSLLTLACSL
jgi:hypothetical protein